ncbi:MAG: hypothetical protein OEY19_08465 [Gammaproteobacteria bacterium]|nr:hypothetical protein [Gammaproteobacteria bacterium]
MSITAGFLIIIIASYIPSPVSIGIYWPALLVAIPSAILGISGKVKYFGYAIGILIGSILYVAVNISGWAQMSIMMAFFQLILSIIAVLVFGVFWIYSPEKKNILDKKKS